MNNEFNIQYVPKQLPIFTTILDVHVELNKYLKEVILDHRQKHPQTTMSNVKAWHSSWVTHQENPRFKPLVDLTLDAPTKGKRMCISMNIDKGDGRRKALTEEEIKISNKIFSNNV